MLCGKAYLDCCVMLNYGGMQLLRWVYNLCMDGDHLGAEFAVRIP